MRRQALRLDRARQKSPPGEGGGSALETKWYCDSSLNPLSGRPGGNRRGHYRRQRFPAKRQQRDLKWLNNAPASGDVMTAARPAPAPAISVRGSSSSRHSLRAFPSRPARPFPGHPCIKRGAQRYKAICSSAVDRRGARGHGYAGMATAAAGNLLPISDQSNTCQIRRRRRRPRCQRRGQATPYAL